MNKYSVKVKNQVVMSVMAECESAAQGEAWDQLNRPGRFEIFREWKNGGMEVELVLQDHQLAGDGYELAKDPGYN
jgi:hypothetical protein